ncbi:hypothetical protein EMCG_08446 [[Emmonsia] crescens]|uniref:Uncharacterized protein n=1 Tax=[Emmonsia] crescens TaxID=73230 RepID=A0A0G2JAH5_9EURO|nr:hypothetical protein EMCG_08446 [Emmonsia crescens UAMH 3008]
MTPQSPEDSDETDLGYFAGTETEEEDIEEMAEPFYNITASSLQLLSINLATVALLLSGWPRGLENKTDVALKIIASSGESGEREVQMQQEILRSVRDTSHLVMYLVTFSLHGDNNQFPWRSTCLGDLIMWEIPMAIYSNVRC